MPRLVTPKTADIEETTVVMGAQALRKLIVVLNLEPKGLRINNMCNLIRHEVAPSSSSPHEKPRV